MNSVCMRLRFNCTCRLPGMSLFASGTSSWSLLHDAFPRSMDGLAQSGRSFWILLVPFPKFLGHLQLHGVCEACKQNRLLSLRVSSSGAWPSTEELCRAMLLLFIDDAKQASFILLACPFPLR